MSFQMKIMGFVCIFLGISLCARVLPIAKITSAETPAITSEYNASEPTAPNPSLLRQQYTQRSIFISKFGKTLKVAETATTQTSNAWSPLDYELIGVSRTNGRRTGWFKHSELGTLVSARQGTHLGDWTVTQLSTTEAILENNGEKLSLKLFVDE